MGWEAGSAYRSKARVNVKVLDFVKRGGPARNELSLSQKSELVMGMSLGVPSKRHQLGRC